MEGIKRIWPTMVNCSSSVNGVRRKKTLSEREGREQTLPWDKEESRHILAFAVRDADDALLKEPDVEKQPGLAVAMRNVDELVHTEHPLHGDTLGVVSKDLVPTRRQQNLLPGAAQRDDNPLLDELIAYRSGQVLQIDRAAY
jgi:hypothetical protein